jgi:hypothetical protein
MNTHLYKPIIYLLFLIYSAVSSAAQPINDSAALGNLKTGKGVFLVDIGDPQKLNFYLQVIQGTWKNMSDQGVTPDFVLVYIPMIPGNTGFSMAKEVQILGMKSQEQSLYFKIS